MSEITKKALGASLKKLLSKKELSKITIKDVTDDCGVDRQTFYYHFKDVYDLIEWIYINEVIYEIKDDATYDSWQQGFLYIFNYIAKNKNFIMNTYHSMNIEYIMRFLNEQTNKLLITVINEESKDISINEKDKIFIANFYGYGLGGIILNWIKNGMIESPEELTEKASRMIEGDFKKAINILKI